MSNPCGIETAIEDIAVVAGDTITVLPGDYALPGFGTTLEPEESPVTIRAQPGGARPNIVVGDDALDVSAGDTVRGLYIEGTSGSQTLHASGATVEQMQIHSSGANDVGAILRNGAVLRDSFVSTAMAGDPAVLVDGGGATLSGVTAIGLGVNSRGVEGFPVTQVVTLRNVIARGSGAGPGILAVDDADADNLDINVSFTNYSSIAETTPEADVIEGPGNQTAAPLFGQPRSRRPLTSTNSRGRRPSTWEARMQPPELSTSTEKRGSWGRRWISAEMSSPGTPPRSRGRRPQPR